MLEKEKETTIFMLLREREIEKEEREKLMHEPIHLRERERE